MTRRRDSAHFGSTRDAPSDMVRVVEHGGVRRGVAVTFDADEMGAMFMARARHIESCIEQAMADGYRGWLRVVDTSKPTDDGLEFSTVVERVDEPKASPPSMWLRESFLNTASILPMADA